jgi:protein-S-isoprenylcysteine O-methyltransferase Ste14
MIRILLFIILSIPIVFISRRSLFSFINHGLYRFVAWECILWLAISNIFYWYKDMLSVNQIISWILLVLALYTVISGISIIKRSGKTDSLRDNSLFEFEKTSKLIQTGIFKYIRHPLYASLILLTWGIFFKHVGYFLLFISVLSSLALLLTALIEERENIRYFGEKYRDYMKKTWMFFPYIL